MEPSTKIAANKALKWALYFLGIFIFAKLFSGLTAGAWPSSIEIISTFTGLIIFYPFLFFGLWGWFIFTKNDSLSESKAEKQKNPGKTKEGIELNPANDEFYKVAINEISSSHVHQGLWARCLAESDGDRDKLTARYIKYRAEQLLQEQSVKNAREFGLTENEIWYLRIPIKGVHYVEKYKITKDQLAQACASSEIKSVISNGVLWVEDNH